MDLLRDFENINLGIPSPDHPEIVLENHSQSNQRIAKENTTLSTNDVFTSEDKKSQSDEIDDDNYTKNRNYLKETILKHFRRNRFMCRFCPNQTLSSKPCKKHKLCRLKGISYDCKFCDEHFDFKPILMAHIRSTHSKLLTIFQNSKLEKLTKRAVKGMLPNIQTLQNALNNYSKIR